jgi:hypothetical protein
MRPRLQRKPTVEPPKKPEPEFNQEQESRIKKHMKKCVHYTGVSQGKCQAGIFYWSVKAKSSRGRDTYPCYNTLLTNCAVCRRFTRQEAEVFIRDVDAGWVSAVTALSAVLNHTNGQRRGSGEILCPNCKAGKLRYAFSPHNGHMAAKCTTPNCTSLVE